MVLALGLVSAGPAAAHTTEQPYLYVFLTEASDDAPAMVDGRVELAVGDVGEVLGVDLSGTDPEIEQALRANAEALRAYASDHVTIGADGQAWPLTFDRVDLFREAPGELAFAVVQYRADEVPERIPNNLDVAFDPFFDEVEGRDGLLLLSGGYTAGEFNTEAEQLVTYTADERTRTIDLGADGRWGNFTAGITLGIDHIKTGPDHILFVLALLLPSVLVFAGGWRPMEGFRASLWRVLKIATFFTAAHSITFTMAGMGWLPTPPSKVVETIIALSIAAAALHNIRPILPNREWSLSFVFGLFHGMGFASLVDQLDVSRSSQLISLAGRNVGIEIGQVAVILLLFPGLFLLRRTPVYQPFLTVASLVLAGLAVLWSIERTFETDLGTDGLVEAVVSLPTGYWLAAGFTVASGLTFRWAERNRRLLSVSPAR